MYYIVLPTSAETAETSEELPWVPFQPTPWLAKWCWWVQRKPDHFATCGCWRPLGVLTRSWLTTMDYIWRTLDHISMSQYERSAFRQGAMFSRTGIFWMFVHCSFCHLRYVIPHPWHRSGTPGGASHPLHFASCIASKLRRADLESCWQGAHFKGWETLGEEKNEQLMINYRLMLAASLLYFIYIFFARPGNWKRSQCCEFCGFEDSCCRHPAVNIMVQMYKLLFTANHIVP